MRFWRTFSRPYLSDWSMFRTLSWALLLSCLIALPLHGQRPALRGRGPQDVAKINQEEGEKLIAQFRGQRLKGDYVFLFDLKNLPRRGEVSTYEGIIWGTWNEQGPLSRVILWKPGEESKPLLQVIAQGGRDPRVWVWEPEKDVREMPNSEFFDPLLPNNHYSAFDLLMPYIFWDDYVYEGSKRVKGRPAHEFLVWSPEAVREAKPEFGGAYLALDASYNALLKAELLSDTGESIKTIEIQDFKQIDGQYIIKYIDLMDEATRDKSRFLVTGAAVNQDIDPETFDPSMIEWIPDTTKIPFKGV